MSKWGGVDAKEFEQLIDKSSTLKAKQLDDFYRASAKELAARLLRKVSKRTPVGQYPHRTGGTLRRGWTIDADIKQKGNIYEITVFNQVESLVIVHATIRVGCKANSCSQSRK